MAHFAELDSNNVVLRVIVVSDDNEADGENWCKNLFGGVAWKQTSYNRNIRRNFAGIGFTYDASKDAFIPPQPYPSWVFVEDTLSWKPPLDYPTSDDIETTSKDGISIDFKTTYEWDESAYQADNSTGWVKVF